MSNLELLKSMASRYLGRGVYQLIELRHSGFSQDWNFINGGGRNGITIDGTHYETLPFALTLAAQGENSGASLVIANVDRRIADELSRAVSNKDIVVNVYLAHLERYGTSIAAERYSKGSYTVTGVEVTKEAVSLGIAVKSSLGFNVGSRRFNQNDFPNLYL